MLNKIFTYPLCFVIRCYQLLVSPFLPTKCRYYPSCSNYALEAIQKRGAMLGLYLGIKRILKCQPFGGQGFDPVPLANKFNKV